MRLRQQIVSSVNSVKLKFIGNQRWGRNALGIKVGAEMHWESKCRKNALGITMSQECIGTSNVARMHWDFKCRKNAL